MTAERDVEIAEVTERSGATRNRSNVVNHADPELVCAPCREDSCFIYRAGSVDLEKLLCRKRPVQSHPVFRSVVARIKNSCQLVTNIVSGDLETNP